MLHFLVLLQITLTIGLHVDIYLSQRITMRMLLQGKMHFLMRFTLSY